jgi:hypothetical protein
MPLIGTMDMSAVPEMEIKIEIEIELWLER